jgi:hypothetical protein
MEIRRIMSDIPTLQSLVDWANVGVVVALAASFIFGGASIFLSRRLSNAKETLSREAQRKFDLALATQQERAAKAEKDLLELQNRLKPRILTSEQSNALITLLSSSKGTIEILCPPNNKEACDLAQAIASALKRTNWIVDRVVINPFGAFPSGLTLAVRDKNSPGPDVGILQQAFSSVGFPAEGEFRSDLPQHKVILLVGPKP